MSEIFENLVSHPIIPLFWHALFMSFVIFIVILGIHKGIEKAGKILMPILLLLLLVLCIRSITLEGASEGIMWFLKPDWTTLNLKIILGALGQVFFTLSLGMGTIITYGSYLSDNENIPSNSVIIAFSDLAIAIISALIIIPAVFALGLEPDVGMPLIFVTLPLVFSEMPLGSFFGALFFFLLVIAAITSGISLLQVVVAYFTESFDWSKKKAAFTTGVVIFVLGIPSSLSKGILFDFQIFNNQFLDLMDLFSSKILLPVGGLLTALFIGWVWTPKGCISEIEKNNNNFQLKVPWTFIIKFILPVVLTYIIITGF